jgi:predicted porin
VDRRIISAVTLTLSSTAAVAAESSVTLYGIVDSGVRYARISTPGFGQSKLGLDSGVQSGSRWGLRGSEDLGDGLSANFVLESGFDSTNGKSAQGGRLFGRQASIGLKSAGWGSFDLGRQTTIASRYYAPLDPFSLGFGVANDQRVDNAVVYQSPSFGGMEFGAGYSFNVNDDAPASFATPDNIRKLMAGVRYRSGPLYLTGTYDQLNGNEATPRGVVPRMGLVGAAYDFEVVSVSVAYARSVDGWLAARPVGGGKEARALFPANAFAKGFGANAYLLGFSAPLSGATTLSGSWQRVDPDNALLTGDDHVMNVYSLGVTHALSKRTNLYAFASHTADYAFRSGVDATTVAVGLRHRF